MVRLSQAGVHVRNATLIGSVGPIAATSLIHVNVSKEFGQNLPFDESSHSLHCMDQSATLAHSEKNHRAFARWS